MCYCGEKNAFNWREVWVRNNDNSVKLMDTCDSVSTAYRRAQEYRQYGADVIILPYLTAMSDKKLKHGHEPSEVLEKFSPKPKGRIAWNK